MDCPVQSQREMTMSPTGSRAAFDSSLRLHAAGPPTISASGRVSLCLSLLTIGRLLGMGKSAQAPLSVARTRDSTVRDSSIAPPRCAILKGRVIALLLFGGFALLRPTFLSVVQIAFIVILILLTPWIVVASSRFNARNSTFRNVGVRIRRQVARSGQRRLLGFGAIVLRHRRDSGIPGSGCAVHAFIVERHRFGATPFKSDIAVGDFIVAYLLGR